MSNKEEIKELKNDVSIVNDLTDMVGDFERIEDIPKQIRISDYIYAFVKTGDGHNPFGLWIWNEDQWNEVSDLTGVYVFEYQELKSYAVAVGMITEDQDLFI